MSLEALKVKSKTPLFNKNIIFNLLRRFWPIWTVYFLLILFQLPINVYNQLETANYTQMSAETFTIASGYDTMKISFVFSIVSVMAIFSYLYSPRSCGMVCALPIKRETMFLSCAVTGILPMFVSNIVVLIISAIMGVAKFQYLLLWLGITVMGNIAFYGMALFCACLTGNIAILPLLYLVLNFTGSVVQNCFIYVFSRFVYGMRGFGGNFLGYFTPIRVLGRHLFVGEDAQGVIELSGIGYLGVYCAIGVALGVAALFIYKRRQMETAGDIVAVKSLKPIFKYCMTFGTALVLAELVSGMLPPSLFKGAGAAGIVLLLMLVGAAIGWYAAEMLMQKSFYVFKSKFKGLVVSCVIIAAAVAGAEFNAFGFENRIPLLENVESVNVDYYNIKEPENIEKVLQLHKSLILSKKDNEESNNADTVVALHYFMNNGRELVRQYRIEGNPEDYYIPDTTINRYYEVINTPEAIKCRYLPQTPVTVENISYCEIYENPQRSYIAANMPIQSIRLTPEQAYQLFNECVLPDMEDGLIGRDYPPERDIYLDSTTNFRIEIQLNANNKDESGKPTADLWDGFFCPIDMSARRTIQWIKDNTDLEVKTLRDVSDVW